MTGNTTPPRDPDLAPGYDEEDPYEGEDLSDYPDWWRENIEIHRKHGMRPYRPSQFTDGALVPEVVEEVEQALDVDVRIRCIDPQRENDWEILVDGETVARTAHHRHEGGYSVYDISSDEFVEVVTEGSRL